LEVEKEDKYVHVRIIAFNKLKINEKPKTLLFKVNRKLIAEPIRRCYSYTYPYSETITLENKKPLELEIFCQEFNTEGTKEYKLIETVPL
jgi:hypothetical protein